MITNPAATAADDLKNIPETQTSLPSSLIQGGHRRPIFFGSMLFPILTVSLFPNLVKAANVLLYAFMAVACFLAPFLTNLVGFRCTLSLGSIGCPLYAVGLYHNNRVGATWPIYLGSVTCGISAGGRYIATWFTFRNFGSITGVAISLGINVNPKKQGRVGYKTYLNFIAIQCLGRVIWTVALKSEKAIRDDGTKFAANTDSIHWKTEAKTAWKRGKSKPILLSTPLFWYSGWVQAYPGTHLATYFTVRSRALGSFLSAIVGTIATRLNGSLWIWNLSSSPGEQIRYSSLLRGTETAGVAVAFRVQAAPTALIVTVGINFGLWFFALLVSFWATLLVVRRLEEAVRDSPVL
ncbi:hypothetical protein BDW68DRAFT_190987 [Aspergillus falconensis]